MVTLICEVCTHRVGTTTRDRLALPLRGTMFDPPDVGYPAPFPADAEWPYLFCPMCRKRAMVFEDVVLTDEGYIHLAPAPVEDEEAALIRQILDLRASGKTTGEIGAELGITQQKAAAIVRHKS